MGNFCSNFVIYSVYHSTALVPYSGTYNCLPADWSRIPSELRVNSKTKRKKVAMVPSEPAPDVPKTVDVDITKQLEVSSVLFCFHYTLLFIFLTILFFSLHKIIHYLSS